MYSNMLAALYICSTDSQTISPRLQEYVMWRYKRAVVLKQFME